MEYHCREALACSTSLTLGGARGEKLEPLVMYVGDLHSEVILLVPRVTKTFRNAKESSEKGSDFMGFKLLGNGQFPPGTGSMQNTAK